MRYRTALILALAGLFVFQPHSVAQSADEWEPLADGIDYRQFTLPGPNRAYVARMNRNAPDVVVDSMLAQGTLYEGVETVSGMANRYDDAVFAWDNAWDHTGQVVVAINGMFYDPSTGIPETGMIQSGWYIKRFEDLRGTSGVAWKADGNLFLGGCVHHLDEAQIVSFRDRGRAMEIAGVNTDQRSAGLVIYTPQYDAHTHNGDQGVEVLVEMLRPAGIIPLPRMATGYIRHIGIGAGPTYIPFDHLVISARGEAGRQLLEYARIGERVGLSQEISHLARDCRSNQEWDWSQTFASIGGSFYFLNEGEIDPYEDNLGAVQRNPRTMVCYNDEYLYFVVVDGRQPGYSVGMSATEMGRFCKEVLEAEWGINQDGGGSSTMWVQGDVVNRPSDGSEREVANGLMMVALRPIEQSIEFGSGESVLTIQPAEIRLGPGDQYASIATLAPDVEGLVMPHLNDINGVSARGANWWKVAFDGVQGWTREDNLVSLGSLVGQLRTLREVLRNLSVDL